MLKDTNDKDAASFPLFYKDPVVLRFEDYRDVGLAPAEDYCFAAEAVAIPICAGEFSMAIRHYPIVFTTGEQAFPVALIAIQKGSNLFVGPDGCWKAGCYVPAYVRGYPFIVMEAADQSRQLLLVDRGCNRFVSSVADRDDALRIFDDVGQPTTTAQNAIDLSCSYSIGSIHSRIFTQALISERLLKSYYADFKLPDGSKHQMSGFQIVDEEAFRALSAATIADWHKKGWLALVTLHLASLQSFQALLDLNAQRANERKALAR